MILNSEILNYQTMMCHQNTKHIKNILENYGVGQIDCLNKPFDPSYHEAFEVVEAEGVESDTVVAVLTEGYMYKDRILRPSVVKVSK